MTGPIPRTAKGYPRRKILYDSYEKDIDGLNRKEMMRI